jgi:hypothetical protein
VDEEPGYRFLASPDRRRVMKTLLKLLVVGLIAKWLVDRFRGRTAAEQTVTTPQTTTTA